MSSRRRVVLLSALILIVCALVLYLALRITTYFVARGIRSSLGNKIDHAACLFRWCRGDVHTFKRYKAHLLGSEAVYPSHLFDPTAPLDIKPQSLGKQAQTLVQMEYGALWESDDESKVEMLPFIRQLVYRHVVLGSKPLPPDLGQTITVHLRFSDAPFNYHETQLLYKYSWFAKCFAVARSLPHIGAHLSRILIVSCHTHQNSNSKRQAICAAWTEGYKQAFSKATSLPVTVQCADVYSDFRLLFESPVLIASPSSFSHYAGLCSDNYFVTATTRTTTCQLLPKLKPGKLLTVEPECLFHSSVKSYEDIDEILAKLAS